VGLVVRPVAVLLVAARAVQLVAAR